MTSVEIDVLLDKAVKLQNDCRWLLQREVTRMRKKPVLLPEEVDQVMAISRCAVEVSNGARSCLQVMLDPFGARGRAALARMSDMELEDVGRRLGALPDDEEDAS